MGTEKTMLQDFFGENRVMSCSDAIAKVLKKIS